jgi:hypothetical protein
LTALVSFCRFAENGNAG